MRSFLKYWLPVIAVFAFISVMSTGVGRVSNSSRIIGPILRWFVPDISPDTEGKIVFMVRKGGHLSEYCVLAVLLWRALRKPIRRDPRPWSAKTAWQAVALAACFASVDEIHQSFHPSRQGQVSDVLLDTCGAAVGVGVVWVVGGGMTKTEGQWPKE